MAIMNWLCKIDEDKLRFDKYNEYINKIEDEIKSSKTKKMNCSIFLKLDEDSNFRKKKLEDLEKIKVQNNGKR